MLNLTSRPNLMPDFSLLCAGLISIRQHDWKSSFYSVFSVFKKPTVSLSHWLFSVCTAARRRTPGSLSNASCALEKSRMACSHGNLSPKVKLTSNQHLQPLSFASCPSETSKVVPSHMLPAACETVVVERRAEREREISYQSPPEAEVIFSPYAIG